MNNPSEESGDDLDGGWDADSDPNVDTGWDEPAAGDPGPAGRSVSAAPAEDVDDDDWGDAGDILGELKKRRKRPSRPRRKGRRGPVKLPPGHIQVVAPQKASRSPKARPATGKKRARGASKKAQRARQKAPSPAERQALALEREAERVRRQRERADAKKQSRAEVPAETLPEDAIADPYQPSESADAPSGSRKKRRKKSARPQAKLKRSQDPEEGGEPVDADDRPPDLNKGRQQPQLIGLTLLLVIVALTIGVFLTR